VAGFLLTPDGVPSSDKPDGTHTGGSNDQTCPPAGEPSTDDDSSLSDIMQLDGADSLSGDSDDDPAPEGGDNDTDNDDDSGSSCSSDDEADSQPVRAVLVPSAEQGPAGAPLQLEVDTTGRARAPSCVPLCVVTNPRSAWNKLNSIRTFLRQVCPDVLVLSEHWGRKKAFQEALSMEHYKVIESSRAVRGIPSKGRNGNPTVTVTGGGVALVYTEENFHVESAEIEPPEGIEAVWAILTPKNNEVENVKKILVGGVYLAPRSIHKQETIDHIIQTMFCVQSRYDVPVRTLISGDFNKVDISDILEADGALHQICSVATRKTSTLELVITDMATLMHPATTLEPFKQDENSKGKPSDHNVIVVAPRTDVSFKLERHKKKIHVRPMPDSKVADFIREIGSHEWPEVYLCEDSHEKAENFHKTLIEKLNKHFQVKQVQITSLDKKWFNPTLKVKHKEMQKEYFRKGKSPKWKKLKRAFRKAKRKATKQFYSEFVSELKTTNPGLYYKMAKRIGAIDPFSEGDIKIECLEGLDPQQQVQKVAESFAAVSNEYEPVDLNRLPAYLPSEEPPQLEVYKVYKKIQSQKKTKSTLAIDIPQSLRKEAAEFLAEPLTEIFNSCLRAGTYARPWKHEWCTPVPKKKTTLKTLRDVRKIASTSDYSKIFEHFLLEFILQDISQKLSKRQYGGRKGVGTEHLIVSLIDRIRQLQDNPEKVAVVLSSYDWKGAFDRLDPTLVTLKMINMGVRSSIVRVIIDFLNERKMELKMNGKTSSTLDLVGGGPQGSLIGQLLYIVGSDDVAQEVPDDDKFKYIDDLSAVEAVKTDGKLTQYDVWQHVPSDVATEQNFLPPSTFQTQHYNDTISKWTEENNMKINEDKSNYIVFSKAHESFATRLTINGKQLERAHEIIHLGVWITDDLKWNKHISEICKRAYPRVKMLSKLKYVGTPTEDLVEIYCLFIRSLTEYCSTSFHSSLSQKLSNKLEAIQKTCLRVILGDMYISYAAALEMCGLQSLYMRREQRALQFAVKCTKHPTNSAMFPLNPSEDTHQLRDREKFLVNRAQTESYNKSTIPYLQRRLNTHFSRQEEPNRAAG
jgi:hypothetical protein